MLDEFLSLAQRDFRTIGSGDDPIILDRRAPAGQTYLSGNWIYVQLNTGPEERLYRQNLSRVSLMEDGETIVLETYRFTEPERYEDAFETPELLAEIGPDDFEPYLDAGCEQVWTRVEPREWVGTVNPETCEIVSSRRNKTIRIGSKSRVSDTVYQTSETGYELDMTYLWGSQDGDLITLVPVSGDR